MQIRCIEINTNICCPRNCCENNRKSFQSCSQHHQPRSCQDGANKKGDWFRQITIILPIILLARTAEEASWTLVHAVSVGWESHQLYFTNCDVTRYGWTCRPPNCGSETVGSKRWFWRRLKFYLLWKMSYTYTNENPYCEACSAEAMPVQLKPVLSNRDWSNACRNPLSLFVARENGQKAQEKVWRELEETFEHIQPGIMAGL